MEIRRFYAEKSKKQDGCFLIDGDEAQHIIKVLRYKKGYKLTVFDGSGYDYQCTLIELNKDSVLAEIDGVTKNESERKLYLHLYQGIAKHDKMETVVQKAVELGVSELTPVITARSENGDIKLEKLNKIAIGAAKQCGAAKLMKINTPIYLDDIKGENLLLMAYEGEKSQTLRDISLGRMTRVDLLVGAEGGFSEDEVIKMKEKGALTLTLGNRILRTETASISLITLVLYKAGEL